jgi:predicted ATP-binding protein involved in virulence
LQAVKRREAAATELTFPAIYFFGTKKLQAEKRRGAVATELTFPAIYFFGTKKLQAEKRREAHHTQRKTQLKSIQSHEARIRNFTP